MASFLAEQMYYATLWQVSQPPDHPSPLPYFLVYLLQVLLILPKRKSKNLRMYFFKKRSVIISHCETGGTMQNWYLERPKSRCVIKSWCIHETMIRTVEDHR